jgi:uncharacterized DUF497 family protein
MRITWDEPKRIANLAKHGLDFADFESAFDGDTARVVRARPSRTGRGRLILIGRWNGVLVVVAIVSPLGSEATSLVSLRHASSKERDAYDKA